jgi:hypothetical protein
MKTKITKTTGCNIYKQQNTINTTCEKNTSTQRQLKRLSNQVSEKRQATRSVYYVLIITSYLKYGSLQIA